LAGQEIAFILAEILCSVESRKNFKTNDFTGTGKCGE